MNQNPNIYNDYIVELSLTNDKKWVPLRIRKDKAKPNSYHVGLNNISIIFDPIKPLNKIYFQKNLTMNEEKRNIIHNINKIFRKFIIEKYISAYDSNSSSSIIDLCGGKRADEFNIYSNGVSNFFVIDNDTTALKRYFDRTFYINNKKYESLTFKFIRKPKWINLNFLNHKLDKDYENIKKDLNYRYEFKIRNKKVDIVLMNFAIHYLCDDEIKLIKLCKFIKSEIFKDGIIVITYFDGDEILRKEKNNVAKIGSFDIEIIKRGKDVTIVKIPLPIIKEGSDIYGEEPLVHKNFIKILDKYLDKFDDFIFMINVKSI